MRSGGGTEFTGSLREQLGGANLSPWQKVSEGMNDDLRGPEGAWGNVSKGKGEVQHQGFGLNGGGEGQI